MVCFFLLCLHSILSTVSIIHCFVHSNYVAYGFMSGTAGECNNLRVLCNATILPDNKLFGRTLFITNIKPNFGKL